MHKQIEELSLILSNSLCIQHCIGDWNNQIKYLLNNNPIEQRYTILLLLDYQHMYYHIGVAIEQYNTSLISQTQNIVNKINNLVAKNPNSNPASINELHFTGKVFVVTNECTIEQQDEKNRFKNLNLFLTIYTVEANNLAMKVPHVFFTPANLFKLNLREADIEIIYSSHDYTIWKEKDNTVGFALQMTLIDGVCAQIEKQKSLAKLTPLKDELKKYTFTKKQKEKSVGIISTAIRDAFEGDLEIAIQSFTEAIKVFEIESLTRKTIYHILLSSGLCGLLGLLITLFGSWNGFSLVQSMFWGLCGSILSILVPFNFIPKITHYSNPQYIAELLIRNVIGLISGAILYLGINANLFLGIVNATNNNSLVALLGIAAGYSEKFIPALMEKINDKHLTA